MFERALFSLSWPRNRPVAPTKFCGRASPARPISNALALDLSPHLGVKVRKEVRRSRAYHRHPAGGIKTKKENSRHAAELHIGSHIQLGKGAHAWNWRQRSHPHVAHVKRCHRHPGAAVVKVELQRGWH